MGDMSRCPHGDFIGYCDDCSPGWELELIKADAADKIFQRGVEVERKRILDLITPLLFGSCTCMTKTPEVEFHEAQCHYRRVIGVIEEIKCP